MPEYLTTCGDDTGRSRFGFIVADDREEAERVAANLRDHLGGPIRVEGEKGHTTWCRLPPNITAPVGNDGQPTFAPVSRRSHLKAVP